MAYKLKKNRERFIMVDGPFKGKAYVHGVSYEEVPPGEKDRFDADRVAKAVAKPAGKLKVVKPATRKAAEKKDDSEGDKPARPPAQRDLPSGGVAGAKKPLTGKGGTKSRKGY